MFDEENGLLYVVQTASSYSQTAESGRATAAPRLCLRYDKEIT